MGFEELSDDELVRWLGGWVGKVSGTTELFVPGKAGGVGTLTVSVHGDLVRLELSDGANGVAPALLSRAIEQGYVDAFREALRQVGLVFDRIEGDVAENAVLLSRVRRMRAEHSDRDGLRRMLKQRAESGQESSWDPGMDPLRRQV
ncbi:hypothetical protein [Mycobacteroides saopaulense]|uniref:YbaB/EbfC DNA-binding family protein n=1 Tax=Mycobacteroides saopaulense TaxID=1578165 RepID=A0ABX3BXD0_9MYCO|nr:hypothetical protein [Mycobacteroides saopaulense]OHT86539.1 hypothetical protein BKG68_10300 [Mycobacteroides saopaulense]OHU08398.1 hypothetical protein BKG73_14990 [Mycobacteroides saopaulense]